MPRLAVAITALALAGCGTTVSTGAGGTIRVGVSEYRIRPASLAATAGQLTFVVTNFGRLTHNLAILRGASTVATSSPIAPSATRTLRLTLNAGTYTLESTITDDAALGARATLHLRARR